MGKDEMNDIVTTSNWEIIEQLNVVPDINNTMMFSKFIDKFLDRPTDIYVFLRKYLIDATYKDFGTRLALLDIKKQYMSESEYEKEKENLLKELENETDMVAIIKELYEHFIKTGHIGWE